MQLRLRKRKELGGLNCRSVGIFPWLNAEVHRSWEHLIHKRLSYLSSPVFCVAGF
jgi:hypothetical protein